MVRKRILSKGTYILMSLGTSFLICFTALPYYCMTSISFPGWNIYWSYDDVQRSMMLLFVIASFVGAITTLKKRNTMEDIFLNIGFPLVVLLTLKCLQYHVMYTISVLTFAIVLSVCKVIDFVYSEYFPENIFKRIRIIYYICRKRIVYLLIFTLAPMAVYVNYEENSTNARIFFETTSEEEDISYEKPDLVSVKQFENLIVEDKLQMMREFADYECNKLGVPPVRGLFGIKEITDGTLAYYSHVEEAVYFNIIYLDQCSLEEAIHITSHEIFHRYEHVLIDTLQVLEEAGVEYERLEYYKEAQELEAASDNYYMDSLSMDSYHKNELEVKAEEYANKEVQRLKDEGYLK